jgi:hypothetical protein
MELIEKEGFAFDILNQLSDEFNLNPNDCQKLTGQIWEAVNHEQMDGIIKALQDALLRCMRWAI